MVAEGTEATDKTHNSNNSSNTSDSSNSSSSGDSSNSNNSINNSNSSKSKNSSNIPQPSYDLVRGKGTRCLEPGHLWRECIAYVPPVVGTIGRNNASDNVCCFACELLGTSVDSCKEDLARTWL